MTTDAGKSSPTPESEPGPQAWQPFTPRGVAAFADAPLGRVLLVQALSAGCVALVVMWFVHARWFAVLQEAVQRLPDAGTIASGRLEFPGPSPQRLAQNAYLGVAVDLDHVGDARSASDVFLEFGRAECQVHSLLGYSPIYYQPQWEIPFNRPRLQPWFGAWEPALLVVAGGSALIALLLAWWLAAAGWMLPLWMVAFFLDRDLGICGAAKCAAVAMAPGGLFLALSLLAYGSALVDLPRLLLALPLHLALGAIYLVLGLLALPSLRAASRRRNPFKPARSA